MLGVDENGRVHLLFLVRSPDPSRTASLVRPSLPLLRALPRWVILLRTFPWSPTCKDHSLAIDADMRPLSPSVLADLRWYFQKRHEPTTGRVAAIAKRLGDLAFTYRDERYDDLYRRWLATGEQVFDELSSTVLEEARRSHAGHIHYRALPHTYRHLDPLLRPRSRRRTGVEAGERHPQVPSTPSSTATTADGLAVTSPITDVDAPRMRRSDRGVRVGGARGQARRRGPRQASLFDQGDGGRA
ncbi:MAG: hypothetical protein IT180_03750 [Acidobacteria bacterium]|nr:hypothetical protein [Acidobacteriota bacterium]